jgi:hypothetical protein
MGRGGRTRECLEMEAAKAGNYNLLVEEINSWLPELSVFVRCISSINS